ncbi:hypothetical protein SY88_10345 [Clostridiales bacterium PH28_bin88]|nr:hypothetical protein SY88_10345 [Clostridiales bacterium PH28_bin88]
MKNWQTDVLVIGSGLAGIRAAIEARRAGATVLLLSQSPIGKANNTAISKGNFAIPDGGGDPRDDASQHLNDTIAGGSGINNPALVSVMVNSLRDEAGFLADCGVSLVRRETGSLVRLNFPVYGLSVRLLEVFTGQTG